MQILEGMNANSSCPASNAGGQAVSPHSPLCKSGAWFNVRADWTAEINNTGDLRARAGGMVRRK